jgi:dTDP-4-amino-4,6-dideoxygalactose transaminase
VSHTAGPTVAAIAALGATPVLVDVEADTFCLDPDRLEAAFGPRTKAVLVVHLYGHPADMERIAVIAQAKNVPVIEDCAQAQEALYRNGLVGSFGVMSCFSFYPTKNLGAIGDGGAVLSRDAALIERLRQLRTYGWTRPQYAEVAGGRCSRLDEMQAAILNVKLARLTELVERRRALAARYTQALRDLPLMLPVEHADCRHAYHLYVVRSDRRDALMQALDAAGIGTGLHYPHPVHRQPAFAAVARITKPLAVTERLQGEILSLPLFPSMTGEQQNRVIEAVRAFFGKR